MPMFYGVRSSADHAFKRVFADMAAKHPTFKLYVVYSEPESFDRYGRDYQHNGHIDLALLRRTLPHGRHQFDVCGPPPMMASLVPALGEWGVLAADIHCEAFSPASPRPATAGAGLDIAAARCVRLRLMKRRRPCAAQPRG